MWSGKKREMKKPLTLQEALDFLEELCSDDENDVPTNIQALYIEPPYQDGDVSGEDDSEDEGGVPDNVCPAQLKAGCEIVFENSTRMKTNDYNLEDVDDEESYDDTLDDCLPSSSKKICCPIQSNTGVPLPPANKDSKYTWQTANSLPVLPIFPETNFEDCRDLRPHQLFEKFFSDDLLEHICKCSNLYATYHQKRYEELTIDELRVFIAILIVTGYTSTGAFRDMWSCDAMRRNRFEEINYMLHFESALHEPSARSDRFDTLCKLRPLTDHIKAKMTENFHPEQNLSYDESMIAYFGRHGCKQFIKGKPIRFGYKAWSLCTPRGYMINFEIYQGKNPRVNPKYEERFGTCAAPHLCMIDEFSEEVQELPLSFYFDNLFTGIPLMIYLKKRGFQATGTIRENRIPKSCPIPHKKDLRKQQRGYYESEEIKEESIHLTKWVDNSVVCLASTCFSGEPKSTASRYSRELRRKIPVPRPCVVTQYNKFMSGVDRFDQNVAGIPFLLGLLMQACKTAGFFIDPLMKISHLKILREK